MEGRIDGQQVREVVPARVLQVVDPHDAHRGVPSRLDGEGRRVVAAGVPRRAVAPDRGGRKRGRQDLLGELAHRDLVVVDILAPPHRELAGARHRGRDDEGHLVLGDVSPRHRYGGLGPGETPSAAVGNAGGRSGSSASEPPGQEQACSDGRAQLEEAAPGQAEVEHVAAVDVDAGHDGPPYASAASRAGRVRPSPARTRASRLVVSISADAGEPDTRASGADAFGSMGSDVVSLAGPCNDRARTLPILVTRAQQFSGNRHMLAPGCLAGR